MYSHTKKVGSLGRYGARVGRKIRHEARKIEDELNKPRSCPKCGKMNVKRQASGIWLCRSCHVTFAGGAYMPHAVKKTEKVEEKLKQEAAPRKQFKPVPQEVKETKIEAVETKIEEKPRKKKPKKTKEGGEE